MAKKGATTSAATSAAEDGATKPYTVLARRYRSKDFSEVVGQEPIARTLQNAIATGRTAHAYLFCGTRGVGKTSMARIFARALNRDAGLTEGEAIGDAILRGEDLDVIEIDGASNRGIDDARDLIAGAGLAPTRGKYRIYIIDEVHMLTTPAFNALLKTMEEPPAHVKFILCTTEPHKVPQTIQSRCQRFDFRNIPTKQIAAHLGAVAKGELVEVTEDVLLSVARLANGSMRDGLSLLDRLLAAATGKVDATVLEQVFGLPDDEILLDIIDAAVCERTADILMHGARLLERGSGVEQALELLAERFRWILVASAAGTESDLLDVAASHRERVARLASQSDPAFCAHAIALCDATARNARGSSAPRALYDACLARLSLATRFAVGAAVLAGSSGVGSSRAGSSQAAGPDSKKAGNPEAQRASGQPRATLPTATSTSHQVPTPSAEFGPSRSAASQLQNVAPPQQLGSQSSALQSSALQSGGSIRAQPEQASTPKPAATLRDLCERLEAMAARSPKDQALISQIEVVEFTGEAAKVAVRADDGTGRYLATNPDPIRTVISRAAGRPVRMTLEVRGGETRVAIPKATAIDDPSVRADPLVRRAAELLDATIVAITPRLSLEGVGDGSGDGSGDGAGDGSNRPSDVVGSGGGFGPLASDDDADFENRYGA